MSDAILKAIYETKRENLILAFKNPQVKDTIGDSYIYAYAYAKRMSPCFDIELENNDPFRDTYEIKKDFLDEVTEYLDKKWREGIQYLPTFYDLESKFGHNKLSELISIIGFSPHYHHIFSHSLEVLTKCIKP